MNTLRTAKENIQKSIYQELRTAPADRQVELLRWLAAYAQRIIDQGGIAPKKQKTRQG